MRLIVFARRVLLALLLYGPCAVCLDGQDVDWRTHHKFQNRYEGLIGFKNGRASYRIVDLIGVANGESIGDPSELHILYYVPPAATLVDFRVGERVVDKQYTMIPIDPPHEQDRWNTFDHWPVRDVISNSGVRIENLAPLITAKSDTDQNVLIPAFIFGRSRPTHFQKYVLSIMVDRAIESVSCVVSDDRGNVLKRNGRGICQKEGDSGRTEASSVTFFDIPISNLNRGLLNVRIKAKYVNDAGGSMLNLQTSFFHEPPPIPGT